MEDFYIEFFDQIWALRKGFCKDWFLNAFLKEGKFALFSGIPSSLFWAIKSCLDPCSYFLAGIKYLRSCVRVIISYIEWKPCQWPVKFVKQQFENHCYRMNRLLTVFVYGMECILKHSNILGHLTFFFFLVLKAGCIYVLLVLVWQKCLIFFLFGTHRLFFNHTKDIHTHNPCVLWFSFVLVRKS